MSREQDFVLRNAIEYIKREKDKLKFIYILLFNTPLKVPKKTWNGKQLIIGKV